MKRFMTPILASVAAILLATSAHAAKDTLASPNEPHGIVRTDVLRSAEQIFPVRVVEVNGDRVSQDNRVALWLKPGKHTLVVRGGVDPQDATFGLHTSGAQTGAALRSATRADNTFGVRRTIGQKGGKNSLEIDVEEGKIYYIGGKKSPDTDNVWTPVVWKVESAAGK